MYPKAQGTFELSFEADACAIDTVLLPGGRWIVGSAQIGDRMTVLCWDCLSPLVDGMLHPVSTIKSQENLLGELPETMSLQYDCAEKCVNILIAYSDETM
jgi:hypothetical protein